MTILWLGVAIAGHVALAIAIVNRVHSLPLPRWVLECVDLAWYVWVAVIAWCLADFAGRGGLEEGSWIATPRDIPIVIYGFICLAMAALALALRPSLLHGLQATPQLLDHGVKVVDLRASPRRDGQSEIRCGTPMARLLSRIPGNEVFTISVERKDLRLPRLPAGWDRYSMTHLSDLHLTGQLPPDFYRRIADMTMELGSRIVVITGDIVENRECLDWLPDSLGRISAPDGVFFVLGNHDLRIHDTPLVRQRLLDIGWCNLGSGSQRIEHPDDPQGPGILVAGNELPWYRPAATFPITEQDQGMDPQARDVKILLAHSPDQFGWGQRRDVDLLLAGHTHGGQIRLPLVGPIFSPSWHGVRYASGIFYSAPTLMHVSRGLAGTRPLRFNCKPEISQLILRT